MKSVLFFSMFLISFSSISETIRSRIHSIEQNHIKFSNGRIGYFKKKITIPRLSDYVESELDNSSNLISIKILSPKHFSNESKMMDEGPLPFEPSIVSSFIDAEKIFHRMNPHYKRQSECTDRAHVWAHEEYNFSGIKSLKAFVFFTASYIESVRFKWWFHVAPMYRVNMNGKLIDMVMDYRYSDRPLTVKEWTDLFVFTKRACKVTKKFSEYNVNPQTENCYLIFESMHYKIPSEIFDQERFLRFKNETSRYEIWSSKVWAFE